MNVLFRLASCAVGLSLFLCASAQVPPKPLDRAVMWDEYGRIGGCDHSARLDNLAIQLQNNSNLQGYLVYYGPESASEATLAHIQSYLVNSRGLVEERWRTIYAGPNSDPSEPRIQLWIAPLGASPPELVKYESKVETFNGLFIEHEGWDGVYLEGEGGTGPPVPDVSLPTFIDMLKARKNTLAYIVAFSGTESSPGAWRRLAQRESENLQSEGVTSDRIRIIYGGNVKEIKETKIQLWILPESAPPPAADAGPELAPVTTKQAGTYREYELSNEAGERWAFRVLLDGLRTSKELRACIIVRLEENVAAEELEEAPQETPPVSDETAVLDEVIEPQQVDFLKLIDRWKSELRDKHKITDDRVTVLFAAARESEGNILETWIVPPGAMLPDPSVEPAEETSEEAESVGAATDRVGLDTETTKADKVMSDKPQPDKPKKNGP